MRQEEKQAAVAARELLKADQLRQQRAVAAQSKKRSLATSVRKSAATQKRKSKGGAAAAAAEQMSSGRAAHVPELSGASGYGASTPSISFTDGNCLFNGAGSFFGGGPMSQQWMHPSDPATWDKNPTPVGGFTNFLHPQLSQNFHFTGDELPRTEKRILWTQEEDVRMMSSWLLNSTDSSVGADRKNEQYWYDVADTYNETTPSHRRRNWKQAKDRFHKVNRWTDLFHSAWVKARRIFTSGYNDEMWIEKAHVFYIEDNKKQKLGPFVLLNVWKVVRNEAKWKTYNLNLKEARKIKSSDKEKEGEDADHMDVDELEGPPRPMGQKRAKKAALENNGKRKESDIEELDKFGKIQSEEHANRLKILDVQQKLSSEKIEQAKLAHLAAKEQKEAAEKQREAKKFELEAKMFETYNHLMLVDKSLMSDEEREDHANTMKCLKKKLFPDYS
ncbi:unnamed protein product [Urochloa humidicola]